MKVLKVYTDLLDTLELLGDAERGRLFTSMLKYSSTGEEVKLGGNERFVWAAVKQNIDRQIEAYDALCATNKRIAGSRSVTRRDEASRSVTHRDEALEDKDKDKDKDKGKVYTRQSARFTPPTLDEVKAYCQERGNSVDAKRWFDYYSANGWKVGRNPMKDWKAAVRTWESQGRSSGKNSTESSPAYDHEHDDLGSFLQSVGGER